jgi:hypothetical protein
VTKYTHVAEDVQAEKIGNTKVEVVDHDELPEDLMDEILSG